MIIIISTSEQERQDLVWKAKYSGMWKGNLIQYQHLGVMDKFKIFPVMEFQHTCISWLIAYSWDLKAVYAKVQVLLFRQAPQDTFELKIKYQPPNCRRWY